MRCTHADFEFDFPDDWWMEAGMTGFVPPAAAYRVDASAHPASKNVRIDDIEPVRRNLSHGVFNDDDEMRLPAKQRVLNILGGFLANSAMPPVQVRPQPAGSDYAYELRHGAHRFYCSVRADFTEIPAVLYWVDH